jgi:phosphonate transport system ATP-binding protein
MQNPDVILADEPFAYLDPALTETIASLLLGLVQNGKRTLVATMHDVDLALRYFPRIIALRGARILFDKPAADVISEDLDALYGSVGPDDESRGAPELQEHPSELSKQHRAR